MQFKMHNPVTHPSRECGSVAPERLEMYQGMLSKALRLYWSSLRDSIKARRYLKERGIAAKSIRRFGLGYAEAASQSLRAIFTNYQVSALVECGLVVDRENRRFDRFRDRLIFPILSDNGQVIAFGGRQLQGKGPKYLNSPESALFDKGSTLFGLPQARASIAATREVIVVEGYLDVIISAQYGLENVVATMGTALTSKQVTKLMGLQADRIIFCFDGDEAGRNAARAALDLCLALVTPASPEVRFVFLPADDDPDSLVRREGIDTFRQRLSQAVSLESFFVEHLRSRKDLTSCEGRAKLAHQAFDVLEKIQDAWLYYRLCEAVARDAALSVAEVIHFSGSARQRVWHSTKTNLSSDATSVAPTDKVQMA